MSDSSKKQLQSSSFFYAIRRHLLIPNRVYKIYVSKTMLAGAYIAGEVYDEEGADWALHASYFLLYPYVRRALARRQERERLYDGIDPWSEKFLKQDRRNFQIRRADVIRTWLRRKVTFEISGEGVLDVELLNGSRSQYVLANKQCFDNVLKLMLQFDNGIEVEDSLKQSYRWLGVGLATLCIALAAMVFYFEQAGKCAHPGGCYWVAGFFGAIGAIILVLAFSFRPAPPLSDDVSQPDSPKEQSSKHRS